MLPCFQIINIRDSLLQVGLEFQVIKIQKPKKLIYIIFLTDALLQKEVELFWSLDSLLFKRSIGITHYYTIIHSINDGLIYLYHHKTVSLFYNALIPLRQIP